MLYIFLFVVGVLVMTGLGLDILSALGAVAATFGQYWSGAGKGRTDR
ncbi:MAG: hypothetical protein R2932_57355 [Caldilineaceae bacterium]